MDACMVSVDVVHILKPLLESMFAVHTIGQCLDTPLMEITRTCGPVSLYALVPIPRKIVGCLLGFYL